MSAFLEFRDWIIETGTKKQASEKAKAAQLVEYGIMADGQRVKIVEGVNRFQFVRTEMVEE